MSFLLWSTKWGAFQFRSLFILPKLTEQEELEMSEKSKKKNEIVIINKFKENSAEDVRVSITKIFEMFCNMQTAKK